MRTRAFLIACLLVANASCEDSPSEQRAERSPVQTGDAGADSGGPPGTPGTPSSGDAGLDAGPPPGIDAATDAGTDARGDTLGDAVSTSSADTGTTQASDTGTSKASDASSSVSSDASSNVSSDAGPAADAGAATTADAAVDPCPPALPLHTPAVADEQVERELGPASGGALTSGTYFLTRSELVINPEASESAKQECREREHGRAQQTLEVEATSELAGTLLAHGTREQDDDAVSDHVSRNSYTIEDNVLAIVGVGTACTTETKTLADGGVESKRELAPADTDDDPTWFSATDDTIVLISVWTGSDEVPSCWDVTTYSK